MIEIKGTYNTAKIFTDNIDDETKKQIQILVNESFTSESKIRIMPDTHAGAGSTIGTTMTINGKVVPYMVGVDIGCGMETVILKNTHLELAQIDKIIHEYIPAGFNIHEEAHEMALETNIHKLKCLKKINQNRAYKSIGTLGGGNHFIEIAKDTENKFYLIIHSGSRNLGKQVAEIYQKLAIERHSNKHQDKLIKKLKSENRLQDIQSELKKLKSEISDKKLAWLDGELLEDYLHDMAITQEYADINRKCISKIIIKKAKLKVEDSFSTIHNYIDLKNNILRKGAISAQQNERVLIPINMRDGSLLCTGKGNPDWNFSAPHGAGRIMSRRKARESITLNSFKKSMEGIYSSTITKETIDEAPFAYKPIDEIIANIKETVNIAKVLKPIYNFKASEQ